MHADHHYEIGSSHVACEDYAMSGTQEGLTYAILSDGCSASKDSDVGARILCHLAKSALMYLHRQGRLKDSHYIGEKFPSVFREIVTMKALEARASLGLPYDAFDATLLVTFGADRGDKDPKWGYICFGDGVVVRRYREDEGIGTFAVRMWYDSGAPYYLSYGMSREKDAGYRECFGEQLRHNTFISASPDGDFKQEKVYDCSPCANYTHFASGSLLDEIPVQIALFSDGIGTYEDPHGVHEPDMHMVQEALMYKNTAGEFVKRRMKAMGKQRRARGYTHYDDVSCAAIHLGEFSDE